jgi:hypothetical protein
MPDSTSPTPEPNDDSASRKRDKQNKKITKYAGESHTFLTTLTSDAELAAIASKHGYDAAELAIGQGYVDALGGGLQKRQQGMGDKENEQDQLETSEKTVRNDYAVFREIARASFPAAADRTALALSGDVPEDMDRFLTTATTSYTNAGKAPYTEKMTKRNYAPARLTTLLGAVKQLEKDASERHQAGGEAIDNTKDRNDAYDTLRAWMKECKGVLRGALKGRHGQLAKLKL